jgi:regulator of replication initiation timing
VENSDKPEDAVRKLHHLKKALARARIAMAPDAACEDAVFRKRSSDVVGEMKVWDECLEEIRAGFVALIAERDRWQIAHDKLRERIDHHALEPRSPPERTPESGRMATPRRMSSDESQDFTAIDEELERLNASMLRAFSTE